LSLHRVDREPGRPDDDVKVIVLDDGSPIPKVPGVCARMAEKYQCVEIQRREENGGDYAPAFQHLFQAAPDAEWVWTFGNDDVLQPKALRFLLDDLLPAHGKARFHPHRRIRRARPARMRSSAPTRLIDLCCSSAGSR
jgi:hypothetical protein